MLPRNVCGIGVKTLLLPSHLTASPLIMRIEQVAEEPPCPSQVQTAANMTKDLSGSPSQGLKMRLHICKQKPETAALMIMRDQASRDAPEPLNTIGIRIIGRGIDQTQMLLQLDEHVTHKQGPSRSVRLQIVRNHDGATPATFGTGHSGTHLVTEHIRCPSRGNSTVEPAITPVQETKAEDFTIASRCFNQ